MNSKKQTGKQRQMPESSSFTVSEPQAEYQVQIFNSQQVEEETYSLEEFKSRFEEKLEKRLGLKILL